MDGFFGNNESPMSFKINLFQLRGMVRINSPINGERSIRTPIINHVLYILIHRVIKLEKEQKIK